MVKGGDYKKEQIIGSEYADDVVLFNFIENKSSSLVIKRINEQIK
jgi:bifunctional ADP-heptose synthase (sugar kinase/adenylyltransferase)